MGLLLSILVFSVGVLEALACVRHIQQGILPAWAPRHVTTSSGRRFLRERWRKSTSADDGSGEVLEAGGDTPLANGVSSRRRHAERQGSQEEERGGRPRPPPLTLSNDAPLHHVRSPDIHWPEHVPHSPVKCVEHALPSPVPEAPGDAPPWPGDAARRRQATPPSDTPPEAALLQRRRTSTTETLPHEEHGTATPLRDATPEPSFARESREPRRLKPAKTSSFEEARVEHFAQPDTKASEVIKLSYSDLSSAGPRTAVVGRIEIKATRSDSQEGPAPWPIVNIDTVVTPDEEGDLTPPSCLGSRRVSFDPVPTVVLIDNEKSVAEEKKFGAVLAPSIRITDDLEGVLRKELPNVIDEILQEAVFKANDLLDARRNGPLRGVSLILKDIVGKGPLSNLLNGSLLNSNVEEYNDEPKIETVFEQIRKEKVQTTPKSQDEVYIEPSNNASSTNLRSGEEEIVLSQLSGILPEEKYQSGRIQVESVAEVPGEVKEYVPCGIEASNDTTSPASQEAPRTRSAVSAQHEKEVLQSQQLESNARIPEGRFPQMSSAEVGDQELLVTSEDFVRENSLQQSEPNFIATTDSKGVIPQQTLPEVSVKIATDTSKSPHDATKQAKKTTQRANENEIQNENQPRNEATKDDAPEQRAEDLAIPPISAVGTSSAEEEEDVIMTVAAGPPAREKSASTSFTTEVTTKEDPRTDGSVPLPVPSSHYISLPQVSSNVSASPDIPDTPPESRNIPSVSSGSSKTISTTPITSNAPVSQDMASYSSVPTSPTVSDASTPSTLETAASTILSKQITATSPISTTSSTAGATPETSPAPVLPKTETSSRQPAGTSSPSPSSGGTRVTGPTPPPSPAVPQSEAFWVSDASPLPQNPNTPPSGTSATAQTDPTLAASNTPSSPSPKLRSSFASAKAAFTSASSQPVTSPVFPKPSFSPKSSSSPASTPKKFAPTFSKPSFSPFGSKESTPSFIKPPTTSKPPTFITPTREVTSVSRGPSSLASSASSAIVRSSEPASPAVPIPLPDPAPPPSKPEETRSEPLTPVAAATASPPVPDSCRPSSPTLSRNPQEVVRRIAELRRTNPSVASEVLLSILGFKFS